MKLPPLPRLRPKQRHGRRFWRTDDMMELLSLYHGSTKEAYPRSWQYRTLIAVHREQHSASPYGKGYPYDWKCIKKEKDINGEWTGRWLPDSGVAIKREVLEYTVSGRLPLSALQLAAEGIRMMERRIWATFVAERRVRRREIFLLQAAE